MSCAWAKIEQPQPVNLQHIFSEDLARELQAREYKRYEESLRKTVNVNLDHESVNVNDSSEVNIVVPDVVGADDAFEEIDWDKFEKILVQYDPIPNRDINIGEDEMNRKTHPISFDFIIRPTPYESEFKEMNEGKIILNRYQDHVFDEHTKILLSKLFHKNVIKSINGILRMGSQSVILHGTTFNGEECAIKVFHSPQTQMACENTKEQQAFRKKLEHLAQQETHNLLKLEQSGVHAPKFIYLKRYIVVMSFIGRNKICAETLKTAALTSEEYKLAYEQTVNGLIKSYGKGEMMYGNLSERSILWYNNQCHFIDVCTSVDLTDINGIFYLMDSCRQIIKFFQEQEVPTITPEELFASITGFKFGDRITWEKVWKSFSEAKNHRLI